MTKGEEGGSRNINGLALGFQSVVRHTKGGEGKFNILYMKINVHSYSIITFTVNK